MSEKQQIDAAIRVWRLCAATEHVFAKAFVAGGAQHITVAHVLEAAGMSRRSFYEHFFSIDSIVTRMHYAASRAADIDVVPTVEHLYLCGYGLPRTDYEATIERCKAAAMHLRPTPPRDEFRSGGPLYQWYCDVVSGAEAVRHEGCEVRS